MRKESNTRYMSSSIFLPERTQKEIERSITHLDIDQEMNFYRQRRMMRDPKTGLIGPVSIGKEGPGTLFTGIPCELLYHDTGTANTSVAGTAAEVQMNLANPFGQAAIIPAGFWLPGVGPIGRVAKLVIRGIVTTAASAGTAIFTNRISTTAFNGATGTIIGITPTTVPATPAAQTLGMFEQELDVALQSFGTATAAAVLRGLGKHGMPGWASPNTAQLTWSAMTGQSAASNGLTASTVDIQNTNYIAWNQNCTAATITAIQLLQAFVYGMG
jgi:hypothetical protein